ncbi:MAG: hypothetical protein ACLFSE_10365 [Spirochaetia bacterium]
MAGKNLSRSEKDKILEKIRKQYDDLCGRLQAHESLRNNFEDRYIQALRSRTNLTAFLSAEISVLQDLQKKYTEKLDSSGRENESKPRKPKKSFADRVLEELTARIKVYPPVSLHEEAAEEIEHFYGALERFERVYWAPVDTVFRKIYPREVAYTRTDLNNSLLNLVSRVNGHLPLSAERYVVLLNAEAEDADLALEVKKILTEGAYFFHRLLWVLKMLQKREDLPPHGFKTVSAAASEVIKIMKDFRLNDLKPNR